MKPSLIDSCETFRLEDDCIGVVWHEADGWHGNLHWDIEGDTDFCGPYNSVIQARQAICAEFSLRLEEVKLLDQEMSE